MARTRTLAELRTETLQLADMEASSNLIDTALNGEVDRYINQGIAELYDLIIDSSAQEWYLRLDQTGVTVSGTKEYTLPSDMYLLKGIDLVDGDERATLTPYMFSERNQYEGHLLRHRTGRPSRYRVSGETVDASGVHSSIIRFVPEPDGVYEYDVWYYPHAPELDADADVWDGFNGWEEYVTVFAATKLLQKEATDTSTLDLRKAELTERIRTMASHRDHNNAEHIVDVMGDYDNDTWWYR